MKTTFQKLALGLTVAVASAPMLIGPSAQAGDWNGGLKGMRGSHVPVPAPVPIPDYSPKWYMRADVGLGLNVGTDLNESGMTYGRDDFAGSDIEANAPGEGPFGLGGILNSGHDTGYSIGLGVGYYFSPNFRMDITGEMRQEKQGSISDNFTYTYIDPTPPTPPINRVQVDGTVQDKTEIQSAIFMANAYYDMTRVGRWKPYIGGGLGFAVNDLRRTHTTSMTQCAPQVLGDCDTPTSAGSLTGRTDRQYTYSLAANLTAGVSYKVSDVTSLDFNYRYLYVGGSDVSTTINGYDSKIDVEDQHEHYLRAGLRFDIN